MAGIAIRQLTAVDKGVELNPSPMAFDRQRVSGRHGLLPGQPKQLCSAARAECRISLIVATAL
jgi:hypothetical protein